MEPCTTSWNDSPPAQLGGKKSRLLRTIVASGAAALGLLFTGLSPPAHADVTTKIASACAGLTEFTFPATTITSASTVPNGTLSHRGKPIAQHCLVTGRMNERVSAVDGEEYAISFEMRLPTDWSGQYLYQGNVGLNGFVTTALGTAGGSESALQMGMAVISSDSGHTSSQNPTFGLDPQARLDYGYQATGTLTPMAKALIDTAYGSEPEFSYMAGSSNGGRHTMVGASRYADDYDGFLAVAPSFHRPQAAIAQLWGAQQWNTVTTNKNLDSAFTNEERVLVAEAILEQCDALDGLADGMVFASANCQEMFNVAHHVPTCASDRDGTCLTSEQQRVITDVFDGATTSDGSAIYSSFPYDPGLVSESWASWQFKAPVTRDSVVLGYIYSSPPYAPAMSALGQFVLTLDIDEANESIYATSERYAQSAVDFMVPPDLTYQDLKASGGKMMVLHGASDGVFSMEDTSSWYRNLQAAHGNAADFVRYYEIPGMAHTRGGPATDQHDSLTALINWVEKNEQPEALNAWVNPANKALPADWSTNRTRPLCAYPEIAFYTAGDPERAASFKCRVTERSEILNARVAATDGQPGSAALTLTILFLVIPGISAVAYMWKRRKHS